MTDEVNYMVMSGAEFRREVGCNPGKWADAFAQRCHVAPQLATDRALLVLWFDGAMEAARADALRMQRSLTGKFE
jgi:hypothetical protein